VRDPHSHSPPPFASMGSMRKRPLGWLLVAVTVLAGESGAGPLQHRVWVLDPALGAPEVAELRRVGVDGAVVPVGSVEVAPGSARLTVGKLPELDSLQGVSVVPLLWASGRGDAAGDAEAFLQQFSVVARNFTRGGVVFAVREPWPGLPRFAAAVAKRLGAPVEVVMAATALAQLGNAAVWEGAVVTAVAFGNPEALGFPASTIHDDLQALEAIEDLDLPFRVALVVQPVARPAAGTSGESVAALAKGTVADYRPTQRGDGFLLREPLPWGGTLLPRGASIEVSVVDSARYHRDLGLVLRPVRNRLLGWDTVGVPPHAPALGMSLEALVDYLLGNPPQPAPAIAVEWPTPLRLRVAVANESPHSSAAATGGNWIELAFPGGVVADVELGEFRGLEYGQVVGGQFRKAPSGEASALRLFVNFFAPMGQVGAAEVRFIQRPRELSGRWGARLSDGSTVSGGVQPLPLPGRR